jgi:hypothetical protein
LNLSQEKELTMKHIWTVRIMAIMLRMMPAFSMFLGVSLVFVNHVFSEGEWRDPRLRDIVVTSPDYKGEYYDALVPDTLELTELAALSINAMTRLVNPEYDYAQYIFAELRADPPVLIMGGGAFTNLNTRYMESLPLVRMMTGSTFNRDVSAHIVEGLWHRTA